MLTDHLVSGLCCLGHGKYTTRDGLSASYVGAATILKLANFNVHHVTQDMLALRAARANQFIIFEQLLRYGI